MKVSNNYNVMPRQPKSPNLAYARQKFLRHKRAVCRCRCRCRTALKLGYAPEAAAAAACLCYYL